MTDEEAAELALLLLANDRGKFAISVGAELDQPQQEALERLQEREWIRLVDITPIGKVPGPATPIGRAGAPVFRVFMLNAPALAFVKRLIPALKG